MLEGPFGVLVALALSAYFAGSEIAFTSLNPVLILIWLKDRRPGAALTDRYHKRPDDFLITTLVGNNLANIACTSIATVWLIGRGWPEWVIFSAVAAGILLVGEILPKVLFRELAHRLFPLLALPGRFFHLLFLPAVAPLSAVTRGLARSSRSEDGLRGLGDLRAHIGFIFDSAGRSGALALDKTELLGKALGLRELSIGDLMSPRMELVALSLNQDPADLGRLAVKHGYSKFPVYRGSLDHIVGYVTARDLFRGPADFKEILRPIAHLPESLSARDLLARFARHQWKLAVVLDEYGGTAGLVTIEDLLEALVGDIEDEYDVTRTPLVPLADGRVFADARVKADTFFQGLGFAPPEGEWGTLGGWLTTELGRIPAQGERIVLAGLVFRIVSASRSRLSNVIVEIPEAERAPRRDDTRPRSAARGDSGESATGSSET